MRVTVYAAALACALVFVVANPVEAKAATNNINLTDGIQIALLEPSDDIPFIAETQGSEADPSNEKTDEAISHTVKSGDTLIGIAKLYGIDWHRIFDKNTELDNPDSIEPGSVLVIPKDDEQLVQRPVPVPVRKPAAARPQARGTSAYKTVPASIPGNASSAGNGYVAGYCTWYVKSRRPDLPNNLGNAATWVSRAAAQGLPTGSVPRAGAVGQRNNHVVYIESVNTDGTVTISEMNYRSLYAITTRTLPADYFSYIY